MFSRGKMTSSWANRKSRPSYEKVWGQPQRSKKQHVISKEICTLMLACVSTQIKRGIPRLLKRMLRTAEFSVARVSGTYIEGNERIPLKVGWCELQQPRWHITRNICFWLLLHSMAVRSRDKYCARRDIHSTWYIAIHTMARAIMIFKKLHASQLEFI